ncbi:DMT family transporter [Reinekea marina]|uniref:DMT family transporter n=1 Tax=Reinekea marina TaxID=1310421 RepID=A0ABV7WPB0_9GAMM|nr:DMT family transporter [Reinekea marina]MDN3648658.1 DMT family transporter [Reinekea marina]
MSPKSLSLLLVLSALWGASFLFMRVGAPEFGPVSLIFIRMSVGVLAILPFFFKVSLLKAIIKNAKALLLLGLINHVIPFVALSYAALSLESGFTSLINATTPIFTALVAALFFATAIKPSQILGLIVAVLGVGILSSDKMSFGSLGTGWAIAAGLMAALSYGFAGNYTKHALSHLSAIEITVGSMLASSLILLVPGLYFWPTTNPSTQAWASALLLAVASTGVAFIIFFKIMKEAGAFIASNVTLLVPLFAVSWGIFLLDESLTLRLILGMVVTLSGTALTLQLLKLHSLNSRIASLKIKKAP